MNKACLSNYPHHCFLLLIPKSIMKTNTCSLFSLQPILLIPGSRCRKMVFSNNLFTFLVKLSAGSVHWLRFSMKHRVREGGYHSFTPWRSLFPARPAWGTEALLPPPAPYTADACACVNFWSDKIWWWQQDMNKTNYHRAGCVRGPGHSLGWSKLIVRNIKALVHNVNRVIKGISV